MSVPLWSPFSWRRAEKHAFGWQLLTAIFTDVSWPSAYVSCAPRATQTVFRAQQGFQSWAILIWCDSLPGTCLGTPPPVLLQTFARQCCRWRLFPPQTPSFPFSFLRNQTYTAVSSTSSCFLSHVSFLGLSPNESLECWNLILAPASQRSCTETNINSCIYTYHNYVYAWWACFKLYPTTILQVVHLHMWLTNLKSHVSSSLWNLNAYPTAVLTSLLDTWKLNISRFNFYFPCLPCCSFIKLQNYF